MNKVLSLAMAVLVAFAAIGCTTAPKNTAVKDNAVVEKLDSVQKQLETLSKRVAALENLNEFSCLRFQALEERVAEFTKINVKLDQLKAEMEFNNKLVNAEMETFQNRVTSAARITSEKLGEQLKKAEKLQAELEQDVKKK